MVKRIGVQHAKQSQRAYPLLVLFIVLLGLATLIWLGIEVYSQFVASSG